MRLMCCLHVPVRCWLGCLASVASLCLGLRMRLRVDDQEQKEKQKKWYEWSFVLCVSVENVRNVVGHRQGSQLTDMSKKKLNYNS